jgi:hypothetical protein
VLESETVLRTAGVETAAKSPPSDSRLFHPRVELPQASARSAPNPDGGSQILRTTFLFSRLLLVVLACLMAARAEAPDAMELSRSARPWEFLSAVGTRAALLGNESGRFEAWVYPLEILSDFHLNFRVGGMVLPAESLARTIVVHPESTTIVYAYDSFSVRETLFVPVGEPGAVIAFEVTTTEPVEIEACFRRDFQLEWPGAIGGVTEEWDPAMHAFRFGEDVDRFAALVGSPSAERQHEEYGSNYSSSDEDSLALGVVAKGKATKLIVIAGSTEGGAQATAEYRRLSASYPELLKTSASYYQDQLRGNLTLALPDARLKQAYDWAQVSMLQGMVENPFLGKGLVAGYRTSSGDQRPGFAWFFGRDALWTALAFSASGDFADTRTALEFLSRYQRQDGKVPHEISQSASFVPWFTKLPYAFASADATPLYIIAFDDYVTRSGDVGFANQKWDSLWRAYQFLRSTYDDQGFPQNYGVGHGWVEGGPLLPVKTELYQSALGLAALRSLSQLAERLGKLPVADELAQAFARQKPLLNRAFWLADKGRYAFALDQQNAPVDTASVLATVPMWLGVLDPEKADRMIRRAGRLAPPNRLGNAHSVFGRPEIPARGLSLRRSVASVHGLGVGRGISLPSGVFRLLQFAQQRLAGPRRLARACDGGALGRLLPNPLERFPPPDLVGRHGGKPYPARALGSSRGRGRKASFLDPPHPPRLDFARRRERARRAGQARP